MTLTDMNEGLFGLFTKKMTDEQFKTFISNAKEIANNNNNRTISNAVAKLEMMEHDGLNGREKNSPAFLEYVRIIKDKIKYLEKMFKK